MKKTLLVFMFMLLGLNMTTFAGVPKSIAYQIMVLNPENGRIMANEKVALRIEIRQGNESGNVVFGQDFNTTTDKNGTCNISLDIPENMDWSKDDYYFATLINGKLSGASRIASVPYALMANELSGVITRSELIGTWKLVPNTEGNTADIDNGEDIEDFTELSYTFNENGTGTSIQVKKPEGHGNTVETYKTYTFKWAITPTGILVLTNMLEKSTGEKNREYTRQYHAHQFPIVKIAEDKCMFPIIDTDRNENYILIKQ